MTDHDLINEAHRATCAECTKTWAELDAISAEARALPILTPSRDLWAGIEARLGENARSEQAGDAQKGTAYTENASTTPARAAAARRWFASPSLRYAAAAALLVTTTAAVTWRIAKSGASAEGGPAGIPIVSAPTDGGVSPSAGSPSDEEQRAADRLVTMRAASYEEDFVTLDLEIRTLQGLLDQRRSQLDSATVEVLERNLRIIDTAIAESRRAFLRDPASQFLAAQLARSYSTKLTLLRSTATMPMGT